MKKTHIYYFDYIRIIAMTSVVFLHIAIAPLSAQIGPSWHLLNICASILFTAIPMFLMISGYLVLSEEMESELYISKLFRHRIPRLLIPLAFWTMVAILWQVYLERSWTINAVIHKLIYSIQEPAMIHFWYMYTLIAVYIISPIFCGIRLLNQKCKRYIFSVIILCTLYTAGDAVFVLLEKENLTIDLFAKLLGWGAGGYLVSFIAGYFLVTTKVRIPNIVLITAIISIWIFVTISTYVLTIRSGEFNQTFQVQSSGFEVFLAMLVFLLFKQNFNKKSRFNNSIHEISTLSLPIYLMHNILIGILCYLGISPTGFFSVCIITIINLTVCYLTIKTATTFKPFCYLVAGITYSEACRSCNWIYTFNNIKSAYQHKADKSMAHSEEKFL